jgi:hypothetical protein
VLGVVLIVALPASASASSDGTNPSLDQYVESVPTATGDRSDPSYGGNRRGSAGALPAATRRRIGQQGGADAPALEAVAGSPALGAPPTRGSGGNGREAGRASGEGRSATPPAAAAPSAIDAAATAATGDGAGATPWLLAGVVLVSLAAAAAALARRRRRVD